MEISLSERFPALTPLSIRQNPAREVFKLILRLNDHTQREKAEKGEIKGNKRIIRRPAGDNWF